MLGRLLLGVLLLDGVEQHVEVLGQLPHLIVRDWQIDAGLAVAGAHSGDRGTDACQPSRQVTSGPQEHDRDGQQGDGKQPDQHAQHQHGLFLVGRSGKAHGHHANALAITIADGLKAHVVRLSAQRQLAQPGLATVHHRLCHRRADRHADVALTLLPLTADGHHDLVKVERGHAFCIARQGAHRVNDVAHALDQGKIVVEQNATDQNGIGGVDRQGEMRGRVDQHEP